MVIYESTNKTGIIDRIYWETGADTTTYPLGIMVGHINSGLGEVIANIMSVDKKWKWDDANITQALETLFSLSNGVGEYGILAATPAQTYQDFNRLFGVAVKNSDGDWVELIYKSPEDVRRELGMAWAEFCEDDGTPQYYYPEGTQLFLKPAPNYDSSSGAKLYVQRNPVYFLITDTTKVPPFDSKYHDILCLYGKRGWAQKNSPNEVGLVQSLIDRQLKNIRNDYASRLQDSKPKYVFPRWR